jgi:hypothetical protein
LCLAGRAGVAHCRDPVGLRAAVAVRPTAVVVPAHVAALAVRLCRRRGDEHTPYAVAARARGG